jgi:rhamnose utilization protein RhaD (predicted bifunctional aldolase and dehydrogenase)
MTSIAENTLQELVHLSNYLGDPASDYAILGEGNSSAKIDEDTFWVKASGIEMGQAREENFVQVRFEPILTMLDGRDLSDDEVRQALEEAKVDPGASAHPSVETSFHAIGLSLDGVNFIGHTHPTPVNAITCSVGFEEAFSGRLFPDEIVVCGPAPVLVPYVDPGLPLAREIRRRINAYIEEYGERPRVILMQNHGMIALGDTAKQVMNITATMVKTARILLGTYALGGPHFMSKENVQRIHTRPDEHYRQRLLR